ncbi:MAG: DUF1015 domain-containing protein, partial [Myxococcales bacterium]|nr:DUF1015 domain-containing protein [Myxococcales bacterium]
SYYVLRQRFSAPGGDRLERVGFFGALRLEEYANRVVLPHERTLSGPKADRLKILRATQANLSSVFMLYEDKSETLSAALAEALSGSAAITAADDGGIEHTLAPLVDRGAMALIRAFLMDRQVVIADGHHRYETALNYREESRGSGARRRDAEAPADRTLAYFTNAYAPGSLLLPIHRVIPKGPAPSTAEWRARLPGWSMHEVPFPEGAPIDALLDAHLARHRERPAFAADAGDGTLRIFTRPHAEELTIRLVHSEVIGGVLGLDDAAVRDGAVVFKKSAEVAARAVREEGASLALYLNALTPDDVFRVTGAGEVLPQKSTFFFPKLPSGLVFRVHDESRP